MSDQRIYDAINIFGSSPTAQGGTDPGGSAEYRSRYLRLTQLAIYWLWRLWNADEIGFHDLRWGRSSVLLGDSAAREGHDIRVNRRLVPIAAAADYGNALNQAKLAAVSLVLAHEAVHMVHDRNLVEEETICRTLQLLYFDDLLQGQTYTSVVTNRAHCARLTAASGDLSFIITTYQTQAQWRRRGQLVDHFLGKTRTYHRGVTADFVRRSIDWWGGLQNRWLTTKGLYLRALALEPRDDSELILRILRSFQSAAEWQTARRMVGEDNMDSLRRALAGVPWLRSEDFLTRVGAVEQTVGESFGVH
jgi:hypothetical protein